MSVTRTSAPHGRRAQKGSAETPTEIALSEDGFIAALPDGRTPSHPHGCLRESSGFGLRPHDAPIGAFVDGSEHQRLGTKDREPEPSGRARAMLTETEDPQLAKGSQIVGKGKLA